MKQGRITLFLGFVLLLSMSFGFFHEGKSSKLKDQSEGKVQLDLTPEEAQNYLQVFLRSHNQEGAVPLFERMSPQLVSKLLLQIVESDQFSATNKLLFLLAAATAHKQDKGTVNQLFDLLKELAQSSTVAPFYRAATSPFSDLIPSLAQWAKKNKRYEQWLTQAVQRAVKENDVGALEVLYTHNVRPSKQGATSLLTQVVARNKSPLFVPFLVRRLQADSNHAVDKKTLLMIATQQNNQPMVQALLDHGADPTLLLDPAVGTASQIAFQHNYVSLQLLIDSYVFSYKKPKKAA